MEYIEEDSEVGHYWIPSDEAEDSLWYYIIDQIGTYLMDLYQVEPDPDNKPLSLFYGYWYLYNR